MYKDFLGPTSSSFPARANTSTNQSHWPVADTIFTEYQGATIIREMLNVLTRASITPSPTAYEQLADAIEVLIARNGAPTGSVLAFYGTVAPTGYVLMDGKTIGSASSGASGRAHADAQNLFTHLWAADSNLTVSGGRGASAAADWAANKTITLPDARGRALVGLDNMGGSAANRITSTATNGANASTLGGTFGAQTHSLTEAQNGPHTHEYRMVEGGGGFAYASGASFNTFALQQTASSGSGAPHNNVQPSMALSLAIKL